MDVTKNEQLNIITDRYLPAFFTFAMSKLGNSADAEELAQEIAFQCVDAIHRGNIRSNFDAYIWSIAHNTYKRWCRKSRLSTQDVDDGASILSNIVSRDLPIVEQLISDEETNIIRACLSKLTGDYRKVIVSFYFDELSIREISSRLMMSEGMVKFYLRMGKLKLKEVLNMQKVGEKSFNPSEFTIYKSAIDFSKVDVWEVFKRKLPCQIALICHDKARTVSEISLETNVPAVYIEEEVELLCEAGVMISPAKDKYRTNFHILKKNAVAQVKEQFIKLYTAYVPKVIAAFEKYLPELKACGVFKHDATRNQWAWYFAQFVVNFDCEGHYLSAEDFPQILSCGSKAIVFAEEAQGSPWAMSHTPIYLEKCVIHPFDMDVLGRGLRQLELRNPRKAQVLYDVYCGQVKDEDKALCAELIEQGYVLNIDKKLYCNVAVSTAESRKLFEQINSELIKELRSLCQPIRENIARIVKTTIPEQLHGYVKGFTETWINFYAGMYFLEMLYKEGMLVIPEADDLTPVTYTIEQK